MKFINKYKSIITFCFAITVSVTTFYSCSTSETQTVTNFKTLVFEDEFNVTDQTNPVMIDTTIWNMETGDHGWGNNELQNYTESTDNVSIEDGMLKITAIQEGSGGYTSARINTKGKFEKAYGRFEARIKLPWGQGLWPAFWLLGNDFEEVSWPQCGEIDIMEYVGQEPTIMHGSVHGPGYSGGNAITKTYELVNDRFDTDFHIFGIEWGPEYINYYVDDVLYNQITPDDVTGEWVYDHPFFIIMNVAVGGNFAGSPDQGTVFPQTMMVDYVRVYE